MFTNEEPPSLGDGWTVTQVGPNDDLFATALQVEFDVFKEMGYTESGDGICGEYIPWQDQSSFVCVQDDNNAMAGIARVIVGDYADLPIAKLPLDRPTPQGTALEYASLAVLPGVRGDGIAEALYRGVWEETIRSRANHVVAITDPWLLELLAGHFGFPFEQAGPQVNYMGGDVCPIHLSVDHMIRTMMRTSPVIARWIFTNSIDLDVIDLTAVADDDVIDLDALDITTS